MRNVHVDQRKNKKFSVVLSEKCTTFKNINCTLNLIDTDSSGNTTLDFLIGTKTHSCDGWVLAVVDAQEGSKLQQQLCAHWGIAMNSCYKADLGFRWFRFIWIVGDFQSQDGSKLYTPAQSGSKTKRPVM